MEVVEILNKLVFTIPASQLAIFVFIAMLLALSDRPKYILILIYGFTIYWSFFLNQDKFLSLKGGNFTHTASFILVSMIFVVTGVWVIFMKD